VHTLILRKKKKASQKPFYGFWDAFFLLFSGLAILQLERHNGNFVNLDCFLRISCNQLVIHCLILGEAKITYQNTKTWKDSNDPEFESKKTNRRPLPQPFSGRACNCQQLIAVI
jgi:hypothetical protein